MNRHIIFVLILHFILLVVNTSQAKDTQSGALDINKIQVLDLETAGKIAIANNPSLAAAHARVKQARELLLQARSAYWPQLNATAGASRVSLSNNDYATARLLNPSANINDPEDYYQAGLSASWILFDGFERKFLNASATYGEALSILASKEAKRLLLSSVALSFFSAQLGLENIAIAKADEAFNQRQYVEAEARRNKGAGSLSDELNFKIRVELAKAERIRSERVFQSAMLGLAALLGMREPASIEKIRLTALKNETDKELILPAPDELVDYALLHRPDALQSTFVVKQADSAMKMARAKFFPAISLVAGVEADRSEDGNFEQDDFGNSVGINLSYNLFAGGGHRAKIREAKAKQLEAQKTLEQTILKISSDVHVSVTNLKSARDQLVIQRAIAELVRQNRDLVEKEYTAGQASLVRLNESQRDLITAQSRLTLALVSLRQAWFSLETDTGRILDAFVD